MGHCLLTFALIKTIYLTKQGKPEAGKFHIQRSSFPLPSDKAGSPHGHKTAATTPRGTFTEGNIQQKQNWLFPVPPFRVRKSLPEATCPTGRDHMPTLRGFPCLRSIKIYYQVTWARTPSPDKAGLCQHRRKERLSGREPTHTASTVTFLLKPATSPS